MMKNKKERTNSTTMERYVRIATSSGHLQTLLATSFVLGLGKGGVPGLATIATAATVLSAPKDVPGGLSFAVSLMVPVLTVIDVRAAHLHREHLDPRAIRLLLPMSFVGMTIGCAIDGRLSDGNARLFAGMMLLTMLTLQARGNPTTASPDRATMRRNGSTGDDDNDDDGEKRRRTTTTTTTSTIEEGGSMGVVRDGIDDHRTSGGGGGCSRRNHRSRIVENGSDVDHSRPSVLPRKTSARRRRGCTTRSTTTTRICRNTFDDPRLPWACIVGLVGGMSTMLTNSMGPMVNVYLLSVERLSPRSYVGTRAAFFCVVNVMKVPMRVYGGTLGMSMMPLASCLGLIAAIGVGMAKPIVMGMNERTFVVLELVVVAFAGLRLCYLGLVEG